MSTNGSYHYFLMKSHYILKDLRVLPKNIQHFSSPLCFLSFRKSYFLEIFADYSFIRSFSNSHFLLCTISDSDGCSAVILALLLVPACFRLNCAELWNHFRHSAICETASHDWLPLATFLSVDPNASLGVD